MAVFKNRSEIPLDINNLIALQNRPPERLPDLSEMEPANYDARDAFDMATSLCRELDTLILKKVCPTIIDRTILAPSYYESSLIKAIENLYTMNKESKDSQLSYCVDMLRAEILQLVFIHSKR
ncbi:MAG: hypothetical protein KAG19_07950 [Methylococcales bacterium]|nr:hypothetical protein [Methylococcales bacterium]